MNEYIYNNEAIALISIVEVLKKMKSVSNAKFLLIFPLLSNDSLVSFINRGTVRSLEDLIIKRGILLSNFNETYTQLLPVSINSMVILHNMKLIKHEDGEIIYTGPVDLDFSLVNSKRLKKIQTVSEKMAQLLTENTEKLYLQLKVMI